MDDLKQAYKTIMDDHFTPRMEIRFIDGPKTQTLVYEKVHWLIDGVAKGLRYGENPGQEAAVYKLINGNLVLGDVQCIQPGQTLASEPELLQSGKHPGKINLTDADNALNILRYLHQKPCAVIIKHNNPCGVAWADSLSDAYYRANKADRLAAFGPPEDDSDDSYTPVPEPISATYVDPAPPVTDPDAIEDAYLAAEQESPASSSDYRRDYYGIPQNGSSNQRNNNYQQRRPMNNDRQQRYQDNNSYNNSS